MICRKKLETQSLILRQGSPFDGPQLYHNLWKHPSVFQYLFSKPCSTEEAGGRKTEAYAEMHNVIPTEFFVEEKRSGQCIGITGIKELQPGVWTVTDIALGPDFHGKGYGYQILNVLIDHAFVDRNASVLHYECFMENENSRRLALSCGFVYSHSEKAALMKNGNAVVLNHFHLYREAWFQVNESPVLSPSSM